LEWNYWGNPQHRVIGTPKRKPKISQRSRINKDENENGVGGNNSTVNGNQTNDNSAISDIQHHRQNSTSSWGSNNSIQNKALEGYYVDDSPQDIEIEDVYNLQQPNGTPKRNLRKDTAPIRENGKDEQ
jgi:hypothetical protein